MMMTAKMTFFGNEACERDSSLNPEKLTMLLTRDEYRTCLESLTTAHLLDLHASHLKFLELSPAEAKERLTGITLDRLRENYYEITAVLRAR
jgi:hypothetical protein